MYSVGAIMKSIFFSAVISAIEAPEGADHLIQNAFILFRKLFFSLAQQQHVDL